MAQPVIIIAEAGVNHNGSLEMALQLVDAAAVAGADYVKFQTFRSSDLVSREAPKAAYQKASTGSSETQFEMLRKLELDDEKHKKLMDRCRDRNIGFLSTPFDLRSLDYLVTLGVPLIKLSSGSVVNGPLLWAAGASAKPTILSTGMATLEEVEEALSLIAAGRLGREGLARREFKAFGATAEARAALEGSVTLLHCTTEYPCAYEDVNLRAMDTLAEAFGLPVGYSDHTAGVEVAVAAAARGAVVIEKHFTLDRSLPGPDHAASLTPEELQDMVAAIRNIERALGSPQKAPTSIEVKNIVVVRPSLVALKTVAEGEVFTAENLGIKRPGSGVSPMAYWDWLGRPSPRRFEADEVIAE